MKTPKSTSAKSSTSSTAEADDRSELRGDSCYFPGCRKDANCKCEICLASINATLDLVRPSSQKSSLTNFSTSKPVRRNQATYNPIAYNPSILSTPTSRNPPRMDESPALRSTARLSKGEELKNLKNPVIGKNTKSRDYRFGDYWLRPILFLAVILAAELGGSWVISNVLKTDLSADSVNTMAEKSRNANEVIEKLGFIQKELKSIVNGKVANCSSDNSLWGVHQDGLLLHPRCKLYTSATEQVTIWGWPLQTAGLITTRFATRSFTLLSGRVTEWSDGKVGYTIRNTSSSWTSGKWRADVLQLDANTWILEYRKCFLMENPRLISAAIELLRLRMSKTKLAFWTEFRNQISLSNADDRSKIPT